MARGESETKETLERLIKGAFNNERWRLKYLDDGTPRQYCEWQKDLRVITFLLPQWLNFVHQTSGGDDPGRKVDCLDCASILASLGNALGCDLEVYVLGLGLTQDGFYDEDGSGYGYVNEVDPIGSARTNNPFHPKPEYSSTVLMDGRLVVDKQGRPRSAFWCHYYCVRQGEVYDLTMKLPDRWIVGMDLDQLRQRTIDIGTDDPDIPNSQDITNTKKKMDSGWPHDVKIRLK